MDNLHPNLNGKFVLVAGATAVGCSATRLPDAGRQEGDYLRNGYDWTNRFLRLAAELTSLPTAIIGGVGDRAGRLRLS